jgi:tetratricopeptide (TPR) repeat protein
VTSAAPNRNNLALLLGELGRREEALAASQEATEVYRELAAARPDAFRPDLASSLNNLSNALGDLGRREEALAAIQEAVTIRRELATRWPDAYRHELEQSLQVAAWLERDEDLSDPSPRETKE